MKAVLPYCLSLTCSMDKIGPMAALRDDERMLPDWAAAFQKHCVTSAKDIQLKDKR